MQRVQYPFMCSRWSRLPSSSSSNRLNRRHRRSQPTKIASTKFNMRQQLKSYGAAKMSSYNSTGAFHSPATSPMGSYASTTGSYLEGFQDAEDEILAEHDDEMVAANSPERSSGAKADPFKLVTPSKLSSAHKREVEKARNINGESGESVAGTMRASLERGPVGALTYSSYGATDDSPAESPGRVQLRQGNGEVYGVISTRRNLGGGKPKVQESLGRFTESFSRFERWRTDSFSRFERWTSRKEGETTSLLPRTRDDNEASGLAHPCCFGSLSRTGCGLVFVAALALFAFGIVFAVPPMARNQISVSSERSEGAPTVITREARDSQQRRSHARRRPRLVLCISTSVGQTAQTTQSFSTSPSMSPTLA